MRLSDVHEDAESETRAMDAVEKELNMREERLKEREKKVEIEEEKLKRAKAAHEKMLQENEAIDRHLQAEASARAPTRIYEQKIRKLQAEYDDLLSESQQFCLIRSSRGAPGFSGDGRDTEDIQQAHRSS
ncbi:hypothetical protein R3I93_020718 [Phoxinus phoxinus]|uniref:Uncharacterized protein n=1 Tax=Phoxinus phoxinus TaxID=58324 RepID=A0AAN9GTM3_9TELE